MIELKCKHCGRYLGEAETFVGTLLCPNCKGTSNVKMLTDKDLFSFKFEKLEKQPKEKQNEKVNG